MEAVDISSDPVSNLMNKTGIMFIVSGILTIIFSLLDVFVLSYLGIVSNLILIISIIMLGIVMKKIPESFPLSDPEASTAGTWLFVFIGCKILSIILNYSLSANSVSGSTIIFIFTLIVLIAKITGFTKVNSTFKKFNSEMESSLFPFFGWYDLVSLIALIISAFSLNVTVIIIVAVAIVIGQVALLIGIGIKLRNNSMKLLSLPMISVSPGQPIYKPLEPIPEKTISDNVPLYDDKMQTISGVKYCTNCGAAIEEGQKFCTSCGAKI
ncbi:MAG: zinc ribbon domain-containing protein [Candidatus Heimdallarchaeaceae archaeon]